VDYKMISADDHLDLGWLPSDLWSTRLPPSLRPRAPRVEKRDGNPMWVCDGKVWGAWAGQPADPNRPRPKTPFVDALTRGGELDRSQRRPAVAEYRLSDMDRDNVEAQVMFGPVFSINVDDPLLRDACYRAYNDWLKEFCSAAPDRLIGVAMLPPSPESALAELQRLAKTGGYRQANLQIATVTPRVDDPAWEPFWTGVEDTGLILSFHVTVFLEGLPERAIGKPASVFMATKAFVGQFLDPFVDLFAWGILERHPKIRLVMGESGLGWLPWVIEDLDYRHWRLWETRAYWQERGLSGLELKPSEIFKRQVYATFQEDHVAMALLPFYGEGHVMWASDYPHPDSVWPNSRAAIDRQMAHLSPEIRRKLTHDNAAALYGLK
jgi:predicted TIM-barrel fold metal-dependent hydrolase